MGELSMNFCSFSGPKVLQREIMVEMDVAHKNMMTEVMMILISKNCLLVASVLVEEWIVRDVGEKFTKLKCR